MEVYYRNGILKLCATHCDSIIPHKKCFYGEV